MSKSIKSNFIKSLSKLISLSRKDVLRKRPRNKKNSQKKKQCTQNKSRGGKKCGVYSLRGGKKCGVYKKGGSIAFTPECENPPCI